MLKLKRLHVLGFKSFCDRTELKFHGEGIAAIIGPNGCGKSNIADAISWVLGEQSAKTLRGSRMEDVIFAGTRDRKPTGMAEVSLTLIDPEVYSGPDAQDPTEIEIQDDLPAGAEDWDEADIRTRAAEETERLIEEAQPGKVEEIQAAADEDEPLFWTRQRASVVSIDGSAPVASLPPASQVVLKIRRRKFQQQQRAGEIQVTRRQRVPAQRQALPPARHPGTVHGHRFGAGILRIDRAGTHWPDFEQPSHRPPRHY